MNRVLMGLQHMHKTDWGWLVAKIVSGVLLPIALIESGDRTSVAFPVIMSLLSLMLLGGLLSVLGILLRGTRHKPLIVGYAIEVGGLTALILGPVILAFVYAIPAFTHGRFSTGALLCIAIAAPFGARLIDILYDHLVPKKEADPIEQPPSGEDEQNV